MKIRRFASFLILYFFSLITSIYLFTAGIFRHGNRELIKRIGVHFGIESLLGKFSYPPLSAVHIGDLIERQDDITVKEPVPRDGNVTAFELNVLNLLVKNLHPSRIFEIGTFDGRTTLNLAAHIAGEAEIFTLDLPQEDADKTGLQDFWRDRKYVIKPESGSRFLGTPEGEKITRLFGDSAVFDFGPYFNTMDFVFVDGSHASAYVENDTRIALKLLKESKGIIVWHDYRPLSQVAKVLNRMAKQEPIMKNLVRIKGCDMACLILK